MNRSERQTLSSTPRGKWSINSRSRHRQTPAGETWGATDLRTTNLMQAQDATQRQVTREAGEEVWSHLESGAPGMESLLQILLAVKTQAMFLNHS